MLKDKLDALKQLIGPKAAEDVTKAVREEEARLEAEGVRSKEEQTTKAEAEADSTEARVYTEDEVVELFDQMLTELLQESEDGEDENEDAATKEVGDEVTAEAYLNALANLTDGMVAMANALKEIKAQQASMAEKVNTLYGDIPAKAKEAMRASQSDSTLTTKQAEGPAPDPLNDFITQFVSKAG